MKNKECMERAEQVVLHTYNRYPIVLDHGEGVYLYDLDGKEYLDFGAGIAVNALGYSNQELLTFSIMSLPWKRARSC